MSPNEPIVEDAALECFGELAYAVQHWPQLAPGEAAAERDSFSDVVLVDRPPVTLRCSNGGVLDGVKAVGSQRGPCSAARSHVLTARILQGPISILLDEGSSRAGSPDTMEACS